SIPQTAAAGGVSFTQPPQTASASFYKIAPSAPITFGYTMTSLYVTPTALTFRAFCSLNGNTYDITTVAPTATSVTWDPYAYEQSPGAIPLAIATYQLQVMDERGPLAAASPGLFSPNQQVRFALYKPQPYTPLASWTCPDCSSAFRTLSGVHPALVVVLVTTLAMFLGGWNVLGRA
ncbi:hypothetical protein EXIGLDRAFT_580234, partial [Exidia glandulosa HHB12029]